jgi:hypothetical protein
MAESQKSNIPANIWRCGADIPSQNGNIGFPKIRH